MEERLQSILELGQGGPVGAGMEGAETALQVNVDRNANLADATVARAHQDAAGAKGGPDANALGRSRGGFSTKIHALTDAQGRPLHVELTPGQAHQATAAQALIEAADARAFIGDTGYDSERIRQDVRARGMRAVIPSHPTRAKVRHHDKKLYRIRYRVECLFHQLERCRRVATRYEKTARNFLALVHVACALIWISQP